MDSTMYFLAGSEACWNVMPAFAVMSSNCGMARPSQTAAFAPGRGGGGALCPSRPRARFATHSTSRAASSSLKQFLVFNGQSLVCFSWSLRRHCLACSLAFLRFDLFVDLQLAVRFRNPAFFSIRGLQLIMNEVRLWTQSRRDLQVAYGVLNLSVVHQYLPIFVLRIGMLWTSGDY